MDSTRKKIAAVYPCTTGVASSGRHRFVRVKKGERAAPQLIYSAAFVWMSANANLLSKSQEPYEIAVIAFFFFLSPLHFPCRKFWVEECHVETFPLLPVPGWQGSYFRLDILHPHSAS